MALRLWLALILIAPAAGARAEAPPHAAFDVHVGAGNFKPKDDGNLSRRDGEFNFEFGGGWRISRHFAAEFGWLYYSQEADTPAALGIGGTGSDRAGITTSGFGTALKLVQPVGSFDFFAGAGVGNYKSKLSASSFNALTFQTRTVSRSDSGWGRQYLVGVDLRGSKNAVWTFQYRHVALEADFGPGIGSTQVGGRMWQLLFKGSFGDCGRCAP